MGVLKKLNEFAPALTLLVVAAGFLVTVGSIVWAAGRWSAQLEAVRQDVQGLHRTVEAVRTDVRSVQDDVRSVQETLPHMVSCMIDLYRFRGEGDGWNMAGDRPEQQLSPMPASCEHALARTTPAQGD